MSNNFSKSPNMITGIRVSSLKKAIKHYTKNVSRQVFHCAHDKENACDRKIRVTSAKQTNNMSKLIESIKEHSPKLSSIPSTVSGLAVTSVP
jgi:hypothetical protein